jgi:hypothetical protein
MNTNLQELNTIVKKSAYGGLKADTDISISDTQEIGIMTNKRSNGDLVTIVSVSTIEPSLNGSWSTKTHKLFSDYNKTWAESKVSRLTEKVLLAQHNQVLEKLTEIKEDVKSFYLSKAGE